MSLLKKSYTKLTAAAGLAVAMAFNASANFDRYDGKYVQLDLTQPQYSYQGVSGLYSESDYNTRYKLKVMIERFDEQRQTDAGKRIMTDWFAKIDYMREMPRNDMIQALDRYVNDYISYTDDADSPQKKSEYYHTPIETLYNKGGDCEDYALLKYFSLKHLGVDDNDMRIVIIPNHAPLLVLGEEGTQYFLDNSDMRTFTEPKDYAQYSGYYKDGPRSLMNFSEEGRAFINDPDAIGRAKHSSVVVKPYETAMYISFGMLIGTLIFCGGVFGVQCMADRRAKKAQPSLSHIS